MWPRLALSAPERGPRGEVTYRDSSAPTYLTSSFAQTGQ
jgi:hypothetical protein